MRIFVIRHAEHVSGHLTTDGKLQAQRISYELDGEFSKVVHSRIQSAVDTAEFIASGCPVVMVPKEEISIWDHALNHSEKRRLHKMVDEIVQRGEGTLIVTHQTVLNAIEDIYELEEISDEYCCGACLESDDGKLEVLYHLIPDEEWVNWVEWRRDCSGPITCQRCGRLEIDYGVERCPECGEEFEARHL